MAKHLKTHLKEHRVGLSPEEFLDILADTFHQVAPSYQNDEELAANPSVAVQFCDAVRNRVGCPELPEPVVMRALSNPRKNPPSV